jgi:hypothetical protein
MPAFRFTGAEPATYWGWTARAGDVASFPLSPPDDKWELVIEEEPAPVADEGQEEKTNGQADGGQYPVRPNKAAPAADWIVFALADGTFQEKTGQDPAAESTTRKSIVEFYTGAPDEGDS